MQSEKSKMTINTYNEIAEEYDKLYNKIYYNEELEKFVKLLQKGNVVLDAGCGNGLVSDYLCNSGMNVVGIDTSSNMINLARKKNAKIIFRQMDIRNLAFENNNFDAIFCYAVLIHISKKEALEVLKEFHKLLKKDGILFINVQEERTYNEEIIVPESLNNNFNTWYQYYNKEELIEYLKQIGFSVIDIKDRIFDDKEYKSEKHAYLRNEFSIYLRK